MMINVDHDVARSWEIWMKHSIFRSMVMTRMVVFKSMT